MLFIDSTGMWHLAHPERIPWVEDLVLVLSNSGWGPRIDADPSRSRRRSSRKDVCGAAPFPKREYQQLTQLMNLSTSAPTFTNEPRICRLPGQIAEGPSLQESCGASEGSRPHWQHEAGAESDKLCGYRLIGRSIRRLDRIQQPSHLIRRQSGGTALAKISQRR